ncbi:hypothetical protein RDABS01_018842 [Bienertia sinuspersici]
MHIGQQHDHQAERLMRQKEVAETQVKLEYWKQRAKGRWLELADTNTKFFYRRAQSRKKRNEILLLQTQDGTWVQSKPEIHALLVNHFKGILSGVTGSDIYLCCMLSLRRTIEEFGAYTEEKINFEKSLVMFSPNTLPDLRSDCKNALGTRDTNAVGKYLGSQIEVSGRLFFANAILASLCTNILAVFLMPKYISKELNSIICKFWWNGVSRGKPIYWRSRSLLEQPKMVGGLGLRNVQYFNEALLVKQAWRLHNHPSLMLAKAYHSKYKMSPISYGIWGNSKVCPTTNIQVGEVGWANGTSPVLRSNSVLTSSDLVNTLIDPRTSSWKTTVIWNNFTPESARIILSTHIPKSTTADTLYWTLTPNGSMTSKSAYRLLTKSSSMGLDGRSTSKSRKCLWKMHIPSKWKIFLWKLIWNALPLRTNLIRRGIQVASICPLFGGCEETSEHLFRDCTIARHVWFASALGLRVEAAQSIPLGSWVQNLVFFLATGTDMDINLATELVIVLWAIWNHRNKIVFEACFVSPNTILKLCAQLSGVAHDPIEGYVWVDGSWKHGQKAKHKAGIGWVISDWLGHKVSGRLPILSASPLQTEAKALYEGLKQAYSRGFQRIKIYSNSAVLIQLLINKLPGPPELLSVPRTIVADAHT